MTDIRIKICGLTNRDDALAAASLGADLLGFIFAASVRRADPAATAAFRDEIPAPVRVVAVFRDQPADDVRRIIGLVRPDALQFHGAESAAFCRAFGLPVVRAFPLRRQADLDALAAEASAYEYLLLDMPKDSGGGTVSVELARRAVKLHPAVFLAGNLTCENVASLAADLKPFGVDVARGVEAAPGVKDLLLMRLFIEAARRQKRRQT